MRVAIYARYSSDLQDVRSIDDQIALARERAARDGWVIAGVYQDAAISGASILNRPGILKLLSDAANHAFDAVLTEDIDRLSRNGGDTYDIHEQLSYLGIKIITLADGEVGKLQVGIKGLMSSLYLDNLAQKTRRGLIGRFKAGASTGGRTYGYRPVAGAPGRIEIDPQQAEILRRIFTEYVDGRSPLAIVADLNREGIPSPRGGHWSASTLNGSRARDNGILCNRLYVGEAVFGRQKNVKDPATGRIKKRLTPRSEWIVQTVPELQIIDRGLFDAAQARRKTTCQVRLTQRRRPKHIFSGLVVCGCCGAAMIMTNKHRMACSARVNKRTCNQARTISLLEIESRVLRALQDRLLAPEVVAEAVEAYRIERARLAAERSKAGRQHARELTAVRRKIEALVDAIANGDPAKALLAKVKALEAEEEAILARAPKPIEDETLALHPSASERFRHKVAQIRAALTKGDEAGREAVALVRGLIGRIIVMPTDKGRELSLIIEGDLSIMLAQERAANEKSVLVVPPPRCSRYHAIPFRLAG